MNTLSHLDSTARLCVAICFQFVHTARSHPSEILPRSVLLDTSLNQPRSYRFDYRHSQCTTSVKAECAQISSQSWLQVSVTTHHYLPSTLYHHVWSTASYCEHCWSRGSERGSQSPLTSTVQGLICSEGKFA
ncbi:hypothetical protein BsWGS_08120 [Bradybaena similaris]